MTSFCMSLFLGGRTEKSQVMRVSYWLEKRIPMKLEKIAVWLFFFAAVLYFIGGLRDIFAPGFFNISSHPPTKWDIAMKFGTAGIFLASAALYKTALTKTPADKK